MNTGPSQTAGPWQALLASRPTPNTAARLEEQPNGGVWIVIRRIRPKSLRPPLSWIVPFSEERRVRLDAPGTRVWRLCDGTRTVEQITDAIAAHYSLTFHEARVAVDSYLRTLVKRGILVLAVPTDQPGETG